MDNFTLSISLAVAIIILLIILVLSLIYIISINITGLIRRLDDIEHKIKILEDAEIKRNNIDLLSDRFK